MRDMLRVWVRDTNARGGIDGHPVELLVGDDQADPARHGALLKEFVEGRNAFAFVGNQTGLSGSPSSIEYLEQRGVPVVGGDLSHSSWETSPMFFPQGMTSQGRGYAVPAGAARMRPQAKKWGQMTCREAESCREMARAWAPNAERAGLSVVYRGEVSIGQPDFTAECLEARNAGVELLGVQIDPNAMRRIAQSCARQDYHPTFVLPSAVVASTQNGDTNFDGAIGILLTAPWPATGVPSVAAMHKAAKAHAPGLTLDTASSMGWAAGKLFEAALAAAGGLGSPPTRDSLIKGLHQLQDETLGGVSPPLTFEPGKPTVMRCWFTMEFKDGAWRDANGGRRDCP